MLCLWTALKIQPAVIVQVCRAAGLFQQAQWVAQAAGEPLWYLEILVDDCQLYDEALEYLAKLPRRQAAEAIHRFGQVCCTCKYSALVISSAAASGLVADQLPASGCPT